MSHRPTPAGMLSIVVLCAGAALPVAGQSLVKGTVTDARTGFPLPGATVQVRGTTRGAVANVEGRFALVVPVYPSRLEVRYIGYVSGLLDLDSPPPGDLEIALEPEAVELGELVVTDESLAEGIIRRAVERKLAWGDSVRTSYAEAYSRFILMREFEAVRVEETISALWWKVGAGTREIVRARRTRPSRDERFLYAEPLPIPDLYDDTIELYGTRFVGPLHPDAPDVYRFNLFGRRELDGRQIFDIAFVPAGASSAALSGYVAVEDSTFDVLQISVRPAIDRVGPPPVVERVVTLEERFSPIGGAMRPVGFRAEGYVRFGMSGASYPTARFRQVAGLAGHAVRVPVPDTLFASELRRRDAPDLASSEWLFDWIPGWVPPTSDEAEALAHVATAPPLASVFQPEGLLRGYLAVPVAERRDDGEERRRARWIRPWPWYNRVDGWQVGLRPEIPVSDTWTLRPRLGYAEARKGVPWGMEVERAGPGGLEVSVGADDYTDVVGPTLRYSRFLVGLAAYGGWTDWYDYYGRRRGYGRIGWAGDEGRASLTFSVERHRSMEREDFYEGWLRANPQRDNAAIDDGMLAGLTLDLATGDPTLSGYHGAAYAGSSIRWARRGTLGSDFGFVRWSGAVSFRFPTFAPRRRRPASFRLDLYFGLATDTTPLQLEGFLQNPVGPLAPGAGFRVSPARLPLVRQWVAAFWQHEFGSLPGELLGLGESVAGIGMFGGHARSADDERGWHHEAGLYLSNLLGYPVRIHLGTSLQKFDPGVTVSVTRGL